MSVTQQQGEASVHSLQSLPEQFLRAHVSQSSQAVLGVQRGRQCVPRVCRALGLVPSTEGGLEQASRR